mgnify:FL=1
MKKEIIHIVKANEITIAKLLDAGILYIGDDDLLHVVEK